MKKSQSETKNSLQALQASETRYRRLFETAQDGIFILNAETGQIDDVNPYLIDMLHYSHEEFIGMRLWEVSPFKDTAFNFAAFEELQDRGYIRYDDLPLETKEGKTISVEFVSNVYKANGNKVIQCNIRNITEKKETKQKLQEAVLFQQRMIDALPMPIFYKDSEGRYLGCNSFFEKFFGQKREQITGKSVYEIVPKEFADIYHEKDLALLQNPGTQIYESTVKDTDGVVHNVIFHKATFPNSDGSVGGLIGAILDITDHKQSDKKLRESEKKYRELFDFLPIPVYEMDLEGKVTSANQAIYETFRGTEEDLKKGFNMWQLLSPEEIEKSKKNIERLLKGTQVEGTEYTLMRIDGSVFPAIVISSLIQSNGKPVGLRGAIVDITERKQAEESLQESEERYKALFDRSLDLVCVNDLEGRIIDANAAALSRLGYDMEEIRSLNFASLLSEDQLPLVLNTLEEILKTGIQKDLNELRLQHKNGSEVFVEVQGSAILSKGICVAIQSIGRDITERKLAEGQLKQSLESLRKAFGTIIQVMVTAVEARDPYTSGHQKRAADLARTIAMEMGLSQDKIEAIRMAGPIHDIGKLSIPAEILSKPGKLSEIEFNLIKEHARIGFEMLKDVESPWPLAHIVHQHHERMDGSGYPKHLKGDEILIEARILAVADVVESMASHRPYRPALGIDAALDEITRKKGVLYDPEVVDVCLKLFKEESYKLAD